MSKIGVQQSTFCYNLNHFKTNKYVTRKHKWHKSNLNSIIEFYCVILSTATEYLP